MALPRFADKSCVVCGAVFHPRKATQLYCSRRCHGESRRGEVRGPYVPRIEKLCRACGKSFLVGGQGKARMQAVYCSHACALKQRSPVAHQLGEVDAAWLAGLFDGEGSIVNVKRPSGNYSLKITVTNTVRPLLERIQEIVGTGTIVHGRDATERTKEVWYWVCYADNARSLLRQMLPRLIAKKEQAEEHIAR